LEGSILAIFKDDEKVLLIPRETFVFDDIGMMEILEKIDLGHDVG